MPEATSKTALQPDSELTDIPKASDQSATEILEIIHAHSRFSGPLPPPQTLKGYEDILPGSAHRIIAMAEAQQRHRFEMESRVTTGNVAAQSRGQRYALTVVILFAIVGDRSPTGGSLRPA